MLHAGGSHDGLFFEPTALGGVRAGMRAFDEEVFGPVASVTPFATDDEAVALANQTDYGLAAAVMSRSVGRALAIGKRLRTGLLHINDQTVLGDPHAPFGGRGMSGNGSRVGGPANWTSSPSGSGSPCGMRRPATRSDPRASGSSGQADAARRTCSRPLRVTLNPSASRSHSEGLFSARSRSLYFSTLPEGVSGSSCTNSTNRGTMK